MVAPSDTTRAGGSVTAARRWTREHPCSRCGGWAALAKGRGQRCAGYLSADGLYARCSREERAGSLLPGPDGLYAHRLGGRCRCGEEHGEPAVRAVQDSRAELVDVTSRTEGAQRLWRRARPAPGTLTEAYLWQRGLSLPPLETIRHCRELKHAPSGQRLPAMVAAVQRWPSDEVQAVHRTYLGRDGRKATVTPSKMMLGPVRGGAVRLAPLGRVLVVAEGIETALSVQLATGLPAWAALSAVGIRQLVLPPVELMPEVVIAADADPVGLAAARSAAAHWAREGRRVRIALPPAGANDFNDVLTGSAA